MLCLYIIIRVRIISSCILIILGYYYGIIKILSWPPSAGRERPRRFYCPLAGQPTGAGEAAQALRAFLAGLAGRQGGGRVLLCLDEALSSALFEQPRYQPFRFGDLPALVVSSLEEMLAEPVRHKRDSWRAMVTEGFDGRG